MIRTNMLYLVIGALVVAIAVLSYQLYQDRHQPEVVHIQLGPGGLSMEGNKANSRGARVWLGRGL